MPPEGTIRLSVQNNSTTYILLTQNSHTLIIFEYFYGSSGYEVNRVDYVSKMYEIVARRSVGSSES